jgi:hypothetical protein
VISKERLSLSKVGIKHPIKPLYGL